MNAKPFPTLSVLLICLVATVALRTVAVAARNVMTKDGSSVADPRDALRQIVQEQCLVHWRDKKDPAPCERINVSSSDTGDTGYAVLADRKGGAHYLLIPVKTMTGTDSVELLDPATPNYFSVAWTSRDVLEQFVGHPVPRAAVGLAANNAHSRTQDQFHIHIECLRQNVAESLHAVADHMGGTWSPITLIGAPYQALRVMGTDLGAANPFELLANQVPDARHRMGDYTFVVAGMDFKEGPGFLVITGTGQTGELLLDAGCTVAGA